MTRRGITCREFVDLIRASRDGELSDTDRRSFSQHARKCRRCSDYLKGYELTISTIKRMADDASDSAETLIPKSLASRILGDKPKRPGDS